MQRNKYNESRFGEKMKITMNQNSVHKISKRLNMYYFIRANLLTLINDRCFCSNTLIKEMREI